MNSEHPSQEQLQRGYDGDLSNQEAVELHRHMASCAQCQAELDSIGRLGQLVRWAARDAVTAPQETRAPQDARAGTNVQAGATATPANIRAEPDWARMFAGIQNEITQTPPLVAASPAHRKQPRMLQRAAPALGAVALAAAALLMVLRQDTVPNDANAPTNEAEVAVAPTRSGSEIESFDFGTNAGQVLSIETSDGSPVPLVWIYDDDDDEEEE